MRLFWSHSGVIPRSFRVHSKVFLRSIIPESLILTIVISVVQDGTLRTATKFKHNVRNNYQLQIRAFDNGSPPLFSDVWVNVNIIEESQYPPIVVPMKVEVKSYLDDFPGAMIGRVKASDQVKIVAIFPKKSVRFAKTNILGHPLLYL